MRFTYQELEDNKGLQNCMERGRDPHKLEADIHIHSKVVEDSHNMLEAGVEDIHSMVGMVQWLVSTTWKEMDCKENSSKHQNSQIDLLDTWENLAEDIENNLVEDIEDTVDIGDSQENIDFDPHRLEGLEDCCQELDLLQSPLNTNHDCCFVIDDQNSVLTNH